MSIVNTLSLESNRKIKINFNPVNKKLIEWLNDNQEVRDALWKEMKEAERN